MVKKKSKKKDKSDDVDAFVDSVRKEAQRKAPRNHVNKPSSVSKHRSDGRKDKKEDRLRKEKGAREEAAQAKRPQKRSRQSSSSASSSSSSSSSSTSSSSSSPSSSSSSSSLSSAASPSSSSSLDSKEHTALRRAKEVLEMKRAKKLLSSATEHVGDTSEESEDDDAELDTEAIDMGLLQALPLIAKGGHSREKAVEVLSKAQAAGEREQTSDAAEVHNEAVAPLTVKEYVRHQVLSEGVDAFENDEEWEEQAKKSFLVANAEVNDATLDGLPYNAQQEALKKEFLRVAAAAVGDDDDDDNAEKSDEEQRSDEVFGGVLKRKRRARVLTDDELAQMRLDSVREALASNKEERETVESFWTDSAVDEGDRYLRDYILKQRWLDRSGGGGGDGDGDEQAVAGGDGGQVEGENQLELSKHFSIVDEQDDAAIDLQETYEEVLDMRHERGEQNTVKFRHEEVGAARVESHPRFIEDSFRRKDERRKARRERRKEKRRLELVRKGEEVKRKKNVLAGDIEKRKRELMKVAGIDADRFNVSLESEFDADQFDAEMSKMFDDSYYEAEDDEMKPDLSDDMEFLNDYEDNVDDEEMLAYIEGGVGENDSVKNVTASSSTTTTTVGDSTAATGERDGGGSGGAEAPLTFRELARRRGAMRFMVMGKQTLRDDEHGGEEEEAAARAIDEENLTDEQKAEIRAALRREIDAKLDEYYKLDYEDIVAGQPVRYKYVEVEPFDAGMTEEEILETDDRILNQRVSIKKLAPWADISALKKRDWQRERQRWKRREKMQAKVEKWLPREERVKLGIVSDKKRQAASSALGKESSGDRHARKRNRGKKRTAKSSKKNKKRRKIE